MQLFVPSSTVGQSHCKVHNEDPHHTVDQGIWQSQQADGEYIASDGEKQVVPLLPEYTHLIYLHTTTHPLKRAIFPKCPVLPNFLIF